VSRERPGPAVLSDELWGGTRTRGVPRQKIKSHEARTATEKRSDQNPSEKNPWHRDRIQATPTAPRRQVGNIGLQMGGARKLKARRLVGLIPTSPGFGRPKLGRRWQKDPRLTIRRLNYRRLPRCESRQDIGKRKKEEDLRQHQLWPLQTSTRRRA